ncbi:MAG: 2Fe-2S iron-sulfur cluster binding domain-containing protein [Gammaproteobacteria bacterium]|nr:2Fe-2S iron-sulfur cluster binding domain-containing protein [Gammaproteobacteria bacterium]
MRQYHSLTVSRLSEETPDSVRIGLDVPDELKADFEFLPGQHLPVEATIDGKKLRRTYSICSAPGHWPLEIGIRVQPQGAFSTFAARDLKVGDRLQVMPPFGRFHANIDPARSGSYLAFAAGSGITPIISIIRATLESEPGSHFVLFYGNRSQQSTMFIDDLYALKNRFPERLQLNFLFSREEQEFPIVGGRLDGSKVRELYEHFCAGQKPTEIFICGPDTMIATVTDELSILGFDDNAIHAERFGAARKPNMSQPVIDESVDTGKQAEISVIMDGHRKSFKMPVEGAAIVDAAADQGIDLPYSCKGGVCATCRTHVREGKVRMDSNYGLEPWELEKGFVLACQSHPVTDQVVLDYDKT